MADTSSLREEGDLLHAVVAHRADALHGVMPFAGWTGLDALVHLAYVDRVACLAIDDRDGYETELAAFSTATRAAAPAELYACMSDFERTRVQPSDPDALVTQWRSGLDDLCDVFDRHGGDARVPWFGRELAAQRLVAARQMEVFAYGQDVTDLLRSPRPVTGRLWSVADFAVRTLAFSFRNRGLPAPEVAPYVALDAPAGERWTWGDEAVDDRVTGPAVDLCLVATQRRHVDDTGLRVVGPVASEWMRIAQCIAGPPVDGPAPGERS